MGLGLTLGPGVAAGAAGDGEQSPAVLELVDRGRLGRRRWIDGIGGDATAVACAGSVAVLAAQLSSWIGHRRLGGCESRQRCDRCRRRFGGGIRRRMEMHRLSSRIVAVVTGATSLDEEEVGGGAAHAAQ